MGSFIINTLSAIPPFNTFNSSFKISTVKRKTSDIWSANDPSQFEEGPTGSSQCITFRLQKKANLTDWEAISLKVTAASPLLSSWYKGPNQPPATYKVLAGMDGRAELLASDVMSITSPTDSIISFESMNVVAPVHELPFRNAGDWTWSLQRTDIQMPPIFCPKKTRLELCFVFAALAPTGPLDSDDRTIPTRPDFGDAYYVDLFRLFLPSQWEVHDNISTSSSLLAWYLNRSMLVIWNLGIKPHPEYPDRPVTKYDVVSGQSFYLSPRSGVSKQGFAPQFGGFFDLKRWMQGTHAYCNAFDLAALTQLACSLVLDGDGKELLDSKWVCSTGNVSLGQLNFGYVKPGTPFGWLSYPASNSLVFASGGLASAQDEDRFPLKWHAWIEVKMQGTASPRVLDASQAFGSPPAVFVGTKSRWEYLDAKIDSAWPKPSRLPPRNPDRKNIDAIVFYSSPEFQQNRIGVLGIANNAP